MPTDETATKKDRPNYKHKDGKCDSACPFYKGGYCTITGMCLTRPKPMIGALIQADCEPFITDLRRDAQKNWPDYQIADVKDDDSLDSDTFDELHSLAHGAHDSLESLDKNVKALLREVKDFKSRTL